jgi:DNA-binding transcriptional LysR family regulator
MDRLDAMRVFLAVIDAGSLSAGSRKLNAPLPSVSRKVADLERFLGTSLIVRTSRKVLLTDAGRDYVDAARRILADLDETERRAAGEFLVPRGKLTITMPAEFGARYVLPIALDFMRDHPEITLRLLSSDRVIDMVEEHVDIAVRLGTLQDSALYAVRTGEFRLLTSASPAYLAQHGKPEVPQEISAHDGVKFGSEATFWTFVTESGEVVCPPRSRVVVDNAAANIAAAVAGAGIARVFDYQACEELRSGALVPLLTGFDGPSRPIHLVYPRQGKLPLKVRAFIDWAAPRLRLACETFAG